MSADRNLLFGILALQIDFVTPRPARRGHERLGARQAPAARRPPPRARRPGRGGARPARRPGRAGTWPGTHGDAEQSLRGAGPVVVGPRSAGRRWPTPTCRPAWPAWPRPASEATTDHVAPARCRRAALPHPAAARQGRAGRGVRRRGHGAAPRGRPEGDPAASTPTTPAAAAASCWRRRSPAGWSTPASCRSTAWAATPTAGRSTPCASSRATASRTPSTASTPSKARASTRVAFRAAAAPLPRRVQRDRLRPQPRRAAPRPEAGQRHARQVRRDAGRRLGPGQGRRAGGDAGGRASRRCGRRRAAASAATVAGSAVGTPAYMSPGAGRRPARRARPGDRRLQPGGDALLPADRPRRRCRAATSRDVLEKVRRGDFPPAAAGAARRAAGRWRRSAARRWRCGRPTATRRRWRWRRTSSTGWPTSRSAPTASRRWCGSAAGRGSTGRW